MVSGFGSGEGSGSGGCWDWDWDWDVVVAMVGGFDQTKGVDCLWTLSELFVDRADLSRLCYLGELLPGCWSLRQAVRQADEIVLLPCDNPPMIRICCV